MDREAVKRIFLGLLILALNLILAGITIGIFASYYTPGNPVRPRRLEIDVLGFIGFFIGVFQVLYVAPPLFIAVRSRGWIRVEGLILGTVLTVLLNLILSLTIQLEG